MGIGDRLGDVARGIGKAAARELETYAIPVRLQQLYKGYRLRDRGESETGMPVDFLSTLAQLAEHIYLTGTRAAQGRADSPQAISLQNQLGVLFRNYMLLDRFDAATGLVFETMGPFGAVIATAVPPGLERLHAKAGAEGHAPRYRIFIVFRGTNVQMGLVPYLDDASTDLQAARFKTANEVGRRAGELARGFQNTYLSCRANVVGSLLPRAYAWLRAQHRDFVASLPAHARGRVAAALPEGAVELYVVGHSLGGAVATLCAYDIASNTPARLPVLVTFGSPPVGNIDFAIDFNKVMVEAAERHPRTGYLRSIRMVAKTADGAIDIVSGGPSHLPNYIHVNTRVLLSTPAANRLKAHSMADSYGAGLKALQ